MESIPVLVSVKHRLQTRGKMQTEVITQLLKKPKPVRNAKLGLRQYLRLTVSISNGFGLFQQLNCNLSLHFTLTDTHLSVTCILTCEMQPVKNTGSLQIISFAHQC